MINKKSAQAFTEFILLAPIIVFILFGAVNIYTIALKHQKLEMASYYASRLYSKYAIRGVRRGSIYNYLYERNLILTEVVIPRVNNYLQTNKVEITNDGGNKIKLVWPITLSFGVGEYSFHKEIKLESYGEMESDPLEYGGGRNADDE